MVLLDEAGMVGTRDMAAVLSAARKAGAKVVLMGDRRQLQSVAGASALSAVADVLEKTVVLNTVRRQKVEWQRAASTVMARGDVEAGLRTYARHGNVELVSGEMAARAAVIARWTEARQRHGDEVLIVTRRNIDAIALNADARMALREAGTLEKAEVFLPSIGRDDKARDLAISVGDKIRFGETLPGYGVRNGSRGVIEAIGPEAGLQTELRLRLESGERIEARWGELTRELPGRKSAAPRVSHAYAGTAHSAQGRTAAAAILHIARKTDAREIYVGLTRHQHEAHIVVDADRLEAACRQRQEDWRVQPTRTAMLERLFAEASQFREKANVIDYVADRGGYIATGAVRLRHPEQTWSIRSALRANLAMSQLVHTLRGIWAAMSRVRSQEQIRRSPLPEQLAALRQRVQNNGPAQMQQREGPTIEL